MNASPTTDTPLRNAPLDLWRIAEAFLRTLHALFGAPEAIAESHTLTAKTHRILISWLRCAEAMMRRLLLIEAAALPRANTRPPHAKCARVRKLMAFSADAPEAWRVSFRCFSSPVHGGSVSAQHAMTMGAAAAPSVACGDTSPARGGGKRFHSAWPLAERYEALLRVFNDPGPYARRLAARLRIAPQRHRDLLRETDRARHRVECFDEIGALAESRWLSNTS